MIAIGLGLAWAGYTVFMWGYCLVRDYNVTVPDLFKASWPGAGGAGPAPGQGTVSSPVVPTRSGKPTLPQQYTGQ
jgi:hypothetical protein